MWGLFVGLVIGALQVVALGILSKMILGDNTSAKLIGVLLLMVKVALIVFVLYLISTITLMHLIWTAAGMLAGLILTLMIMQVRRSAKSKTAGSHIDGKDNSDG
jgi:hypothetical protein